MKRSCATMSPDYLSIRQRRMNSVLATIQARAEAEASEQLALIILAAWLTGCALAIYFH